MKTLKWLVLGIILCLVTPGITSELIHNFANPSFSGSGYSTHVLSLEQLRYSREKNIADDARSAAAAAERDANNTTINKFIKNVESKPSLPVDDEESQSASVTSILPDVWSRVFSGR